MEKLKAILTIIWEFTALSIPLAVIVLLIVIAIFGGKIHIEAEGLLGR